MTQTAAAPPPGPQPRSAPRPAATAPPAPGRAVATGRPAVAPHTARMTTPGRLRLTGAVCVVMALLAGLAGWQAASSQATAVSAVSTSADRLLAVQQVRNDVVAADALATNGFLVGGLEPAASREQYATWVDQAARGLAALDATTSADADRLARASAALTRYAGLVEQARAANRQGLPVGSAYLASASDLLRTDLLPALDALVLSGADQAAGHFDRVANAPWLLVVVAVGLVVLVVVQVRDSRRTHRVLNLGLTGASALVLVVLLAGLALLGVASTARDVRSGPYRDTVAVSQAVSQVYEARSLESFTLIQRGSGAVYEAEFVGAADEASRQLDRTDAYGLAAQFTTWLDDHRQIRALDDAGSWDEAVALALSTGPGTPDDHFTTFMETAKGQMATSKTTMEDDLASARSTAATVRWVALAAGVVAAALAWWSLAQRREEYR